MAKASKKSKGSPKAGKARRPWGELEASKPRIFRPSPDVAEALDAKVAQTGRTQSAVIDEGLRRVFWSEQKYSETITRNFGGASVEAQAFLMARIIVGIEHKMQAHAMAQPAVGQQVAKAIGAFVTATFVPDLVVTGEDGSIGLVEIKKPLQKTLRRVIESSPSSGAKNKNIMGDTDRSVTIEARPDFLLPIKLNETEPWLDVLLAIDRNLKAGAELWWPLADELPGATANLKREVPLRPSMAQLRAVWCWHPPGT